VFQVAGVGLALAVMAVDAIRVRFRREIATPS